MKITIKKSQWSDRRKERKSVEKRNNVEIGDLHIKKKKNVANKESARFDHNSACKSPQKRFKTSFESSRRALSIGKIDIE